MPQSKNERRLGAWQRLVASLKHNGDMATFHAAKRLRGKIRGLSMKFEHHHEEEIAQLFGFLKQVQRDPSHPQRENLQDIIDNIARSFDQCDLQHYRDALIELYDHRHSLCVKTNVIGNLDYDTHFYRQLFQDVVELPEGSPFRARFDLETKKSESR